VGGFEAVVEEDLGTYNIKIGDKINNLTVTAILYG